MLITRERIDELLSKDNALRAFRQPSAPKHSSVFNWVYATKPLAKGQYDFFNYRADMVYTSDPSRRKDRLDRFLEYCMENWHMPRLVVCSCFISLCDLENKD